MGSSESDPKVWLVKPAGPSGVIEVTTTTPVAKWPTISLKCAISSELTSPTLPVGLGYRESSGLSGRGTHRRNTALRDLRTRRRTVGTVPARFSRHLAHLSLPGAPPRRSGLPRRDPVGARLRPVVDLGHG